MDSTLGMVLFDDLVGGPAAPYTYIFLATDTDSTSAIDTAFVDLHPSPGANIFGTVSISGVTPPDSQLMNLMVEAEGTVFDFWDDLTDSMGAYTIGLDSFTLGDTAIVSPMDEFFGMTPVPQEVTVVLIDTLTGIDFTYVPAAATVSGSVKDDLGADLEDGVRLEASMDSITSKETILSSGFYFFNFDTSQVGDWQVEVTPFGLISNYLVPPSQNVTIGIGDSLTVDFIAYRTDTTIAGQVTIEDTVPLDKSYLIWSDSDSIGAALDFADSITGEYTLNVSSQDPTWTVFLNIFFSPPPLGYIVEGGYAHFGVSPGDSVDFNFVPITDTLSGTFSFHPSVPGSLRFDLSTIEAIISYWTPAGFLKNIAYVLNPDTAGFYQAGVDLDTFQVIPNLPDTTFFTIPQYYDSLVITGSVDTLDFVIYSSLVGVDEEDIGGQYVEPRLLQNEPNPVISNTVIRYAIPAEDQVSLKVYDLSGRLVKTLVSESQKSGVYAFKWDGRDNSGKRLPSGIYFYRFKSGDYTATKKLILLR
jgi:hypothetical protein